MRLYISIILTVVILSSCTKEIPFSDEAKKSQLVINSLFSNDSVWSVNVSKSVSVLDDGGEYGMGHRPVENASVNVFNKSNEKVASLSYTEDGEYTDLSSFPEANQEYRIEVSAPNFKSVTATNTLPTPVPITSIDTTTFIDQYGYNAIQVTLNFDDPVEASNYYLIEMIVYDNYDYMYEEDGIEKDNQKYGYKVAMRTNDPNVENVNKFNSDGFENTYEYLMIKDHNFNGQSYSLTFTSTIWSMEPGMETTGEIRLLNTSEAFLNYRISYERYLRSNGNPFAQPTQVYSNVENGIGIFAGGTLTTWEVEF
jgi:hypothetical protein